LGTYWEFDTIHALLVITQREIMTFTFDLVDFKFSKAIPYFK